jgi:hypothetical protein
MTGKILYDYDTNSFKKNEIFILLEDFDVNDLKEVDIKKNEDTEEETNHTHPAVLAPAQAAKEATKLRDPAVLAPAQAVEEATKLRDRMKSNMHKVDSSTAYTIRQILKDPLPTNINGLTKYIKRANKILSGIL